MELDLRLPQEIPQRVDAPSHFVAELVRSEEVNGSLAAHTPKVGVAARFLKPPPRHPQSKDVQDETVSSALPCQVVSELDVELARGLVPSHRASFGTGVIATFELPNAVCVASVLSKEAQAADPAVISL